MRSVVPLFLNKRRCDDPRARCYPLLYGVPRVTSKRGNCGNINGSFYFNDPYNYYYGVMIMDYGAFSISPVDSAGLCGNIHSFIHLFIHSFILNISIAPPQVYYYSKVPATQHGYCVRVSRRSATDKCK